MKPSTAPVRAMPPTPAALSTPGSLTFVISQVNDLNVLLKRRAAVYARRTFGFTLTEWRILTLLRTLPPISIRELSVRALVATALTSRSVTRLVAQGYLSRQRGTEDKREFLVALTKKGRTVALEMFQASLQRNDELLAGYPPSKVAGLVDVLNDLIARARALVEQDGLGGDDEAD